MAEHPHQSRLYQVQFSFPGRGPCSRGPCASWSSSPFLHPSQAQTLPPPNYSTILLSQIFKTEQ